MACKNPRGMVIFIKKSTLHCYTQIMKSLGLVFCGEQFLARLQEVHRAIAVTPVVHVPVPVHVTLALKFSRSPYLDNHSSKSVHTWTIDTL